MVRFGTPNLDYYIGINDNEVIMKLHEEGYFPIYRDNDYVYFKRTFSTLEFLDSLERRV